MLLINSFNTGQVLISSSLVPEEEKSMQWWDTEPVLPFQSPTTCMISGATMSGKHILFFEFYGMQEECLKYRLKK